MNKIRPPNIPDVKLNTVWIWSFKRKLMNRITASKAIEKVSVDFETLFGSILGKNIPNIFSLMTIIYTENAATLRKT